MRKEWMDGRMGKKRGKKEKKEEQSGDPRATDKRHGKRMKACVRGVEAAIF